MSDYIERAADLLFPTEGRQTLNIKFFGVADERISAAGLAEQLLRAEAQISAGNASYVEDVDAELT